MALLSCFVFQEKSGESAEMREELMVPLRLCQDNARRVATIQKESKLPIDVDEYVQKFKPHMMDVVYSWSEVSSY